MIAANDNGVVVEKICSLCDVVKPLNEFHSQPSGKCGRHSYCADCANAIRRQSRPSTSDERGYSKDQTVRWNLKRRYGLSPQDYEAMLANQNNVCAICDKPMARPCVDHDHATGQIRDILCHRCNIALPYIENNDFRCRAISYLNKHKALAA